MGWLPTMATHWVKQLSLSKAMNSDQNVKKNFNSKQQTKKLYFITITYLFSAKFLKMQTNNSLKDQQAMIFMIESSILLAWPLLPAGVHSLDRVAI
jgi:hypothetical protein